MDNNTDTTPSPDEVIGTLQEVTPTAKPKAPLPYTCDCGSNQFERLTIITGALRELLTINPNGTVHVQPLKRLKRPNSIICHHCRKRHFITTK